MCGPRGEHLEVRAPVDDISPLCLVGGGELVLGAGIEFYKTCGANLLLCAYGQRSSYLQEVNGPSESEVMTTRFLSSLDQERMKKLKVDIWRRERTLGLGTPSNTLQELRNILELARRLGNPAGLELSILTIAVHMPRVEILLGGLFREVGFGELHPKIRTVIAEHVLLRANSNFYAQRILEMWSSQAMARTAKRELQGTLTYLRGEYQSPKERVPVD